MNVRFIPPMESLAVKKLPTGANWTYELKLDGYRGEVVRRDDRVVLYSRRGNDLSLRFSTIAKALEYLPTGTIIDGELAALDSEGYPRFNLLQNFQTSSSQIVFFAFDILAQNGRDLTALPLSERRSLLRSMVKPSEDVQIAEWTERLEVLERFVKEHKLEGIVAKRSDSRYESGQRSGSWLKIRQINRQEFVVGGYTPSHLGVDALLVGFYAGRELRFAGSVRAGLIPQTRRVVHDEIKSLEISQCPFSNLPDKRTGAWGQGITAAKMKDCRWLKPTTVAEIEFTEWTPGDRLRGAAFVGLRDDKNPRTVVKEV